MTGGDVTHGKVVFNTTGKCASCHTMAAAGASGIVGPNLDNAFSAVRDQGFEQSTIQQVVADQIRVPLQGISCPAPESQSTTSQGVTKCAEGSQVTPTGTTVMPANLVKGKDLTDVSAFVAQCAGNPNDPACRASGRQDHRHGRQGHLPAGRLRQLPHAQGRRRDRDRSARTSTR